MGRQNSLHASWERAGSPEWRTEFLRVIAGLKDFERLVEYSINPAKTISPDTVSELKTLATGILAAYPRDDLRAARLFYNTHQLIAFWRYYCELIEQSIEVESHTEKLPLISIALDPVRQQIKLTSVNREHFQGGVFVKTRHDPLHPDFKYAASDTPPAFDDGAHGDQAILDSLQGRLTLATQIVFRSSVILYRQFLLREKKASSDIWDAYRIHVFLDNFLYQPENGHTRISKFELIFFANNLRELLIWLDYARQNNIRITHADVEAFLARQTKYYLALSQNITLEENEILNSRKELLQYDETSGVVRLQNVPEELLAEPRKLYQELGMSSLGCPFGRTKGAKFNALLEIYRYYDRLFAQILKISWEYTRLYDRL